MAPAVVVLSELRPAERSRFLDFLATNRVEFSLNDAGSHYTATVRVVRPASPPPRPPGAERRSIFVEPAEKLVEAQLSSSGGDVAVIADSRRPGPDGNPLKAADVYNATLGLTSKYKRFMEDVPAAQERPKDMSWAELRRFIEDVYEFRYTQDVEKLKVEAAVTTAPNMMSPNRRNARIAQAIPDNFPKTVLTMAKHTKGLPKMVHQLCWSVARSTDIHRDSIIGAEMFGRFLEEFYDVKDLLFYLYVRTVIQRLTKLDPRSGWNPIGAGLPNKHLHDERHLWAPAPSKAIPATVDARLAIRITRECVKQRSLQERILVERLDPWMQSQGRADMDIDDFLQVLTEEYHFSRGTYGVPGEILDSVQEEKVAEFLAWVRFHGGGSLEQVFSELDLNQNGIVSRSEFISVLREKNYRGDPMQIWQVLDANGSGRMGKQEFVNLGAAAAAWDEAPEEEALSDGVQRKSTEQIDPMQIMSTHLDPGVQRMADEIAQRMDSRLSAQGVTGLRPQDIAAWSVQMALRRNKCAGHRKDSFKSLCSNRNSSGYAVTMEVMQKTWREVYGDNPRAGKFGRLLTGESMFTQETGRSDADSIRAADDLETPLETPGGDDASAVSELMEAVHHSLEQATAQFVGAIARDVLASAGADIEEELLSQPLTEQLAPVADSLLEALVNDDYGAWLEILGVDASQDDGNGSRQLHFEDLRREFSEAIASELTEDVLMQICGLVLSAEELQALAHEIAQSLMSGSPTERAEDSAVALDDDMLGSPSDSIAF